jgi:hypothetical protein
LKRALISRFNPYAITPFADGPNSDFNININNINKTFKLPLASSWNLPLYIF